MSKGTVLLIDDEKDLIELVRYNLERDGFHVLAANDGLEGLELARQHQPGVVIIDVMMPGMDGLELCRALRSEPATAALPIIMLTARASETDRVVGLEVGADDYVTKPFSPRELLARVKAVLRRSAPQAAADIIRRQKLVLDIGRREVSYDGEPVAVTASEFQILQFLASRPGRVLSRDEIIDGALDRDAAVLARTVDVHITSLRKKLGPAGSIIETVRGFGYRLSDRADTAQAHE